MNIVWSAIIIYSVSERIIFLLISWEMLLLFVPIYTCHLHNVWQFLAIFFFIVSLHNLGSLKSICQGFFCISISCLFTWWFVWCLFFRDFHHLLFQGFPWNYRLVLSNNWQVLGRVGGGAEVRKGQQLG